MQTQLKTESYIEKATYSPEDNKLRLYPSERLPADLYARVKDAGYKWAPKQGLFVAPMWTPSREDLAIELAGSLQDEDTSLTERAEQRAERFEVYQGKRLNDAEQAADQYEALKGDQDVVTCSDNWRQRRKAEKKAEQIERTGQRAVNMFETAQYWEDRAKGAIRHAKYKEKPEVRARRIKGIEADIRRCESYYTPNPNTPPSEYDGKIIVWCGNGRGGRWVEQDKLPAIEAHYSRWISHYKLRLGYEKAMLADQGAEDLLKPKPRPKQPPLLNYRAESVTIPKMYSRSNEVETIDQVEMTKAQYSKLYADYKGTRLVNGGHRVRICTERAIGRQGWGFVAVFLTDSKEHDKPEA